MKTTLRLLLLLTLCQFALATEYFSGNGTGAQKTYSYERDYTTGWINDLIAQINANPNLTPTDRSNTLQVLDQLTQIAAQPGTRGTFSRSVGGSSGTMNITIEPDYIVDVWHVPGTAYFVSLWLEAPSAPPPNRAPTISWNSPPSSAANGQGYTVSAHGHDNDGNLVDVRVWKDGVPFAFGGGGNGFDNDSGNSTSDTGPKTVTFTAQAIDSNGATSSTITHVVTITAPANAAPTITWNSPTSSVANGQSYTVSAHGHDNDGNLVDVRVWKDGVPFAFGGGGNGFDNNSGNTTSDNGPRTVTFTAQSIDSSGATSSTITHVVTIAAPANAAPTITWNSPPSSAASGQSYTVSAHGRDNNGNLVDVRVWKDGVPFAFGGGGNGFANDSGNTTSDTGPKTVTFTAQSIDSAGATSSTITHSVSISAPPSVTAAINASPSSATAPGSTTISWSSSNASSVSVSGNGISSSTASGSQTVTGLPAGTYTYTITAQGSGGPVTQTATFTVYAASSVSASISASPNSCSAPGSSTITWSSANATSVSVTGTGLSSTAASGSQTITGLFAGTYNYTITAQGPNGPATQTATVTVNAPSSVSGSIAASPSSATAPGSTTIAWSTSNATAVSVTGNGINSTAANGSQTVSGLNSGTYTYTLTAQGPGGPITRTATFTVTAAAPNVSGSIGASPSTATAPGSTTISWNTSDASSVSVSGPGLNSTTASGSQLVSGLAAGTYTYTLTAQGNGGPITRTATVTVNATGPNVAGNISIFPANMNVGGTATLMWSTTNATSVKVTGFSITGGPYESSPNLTVNIGGLPAGTFTYTLVANGAGGPVTRTATIVVNSNDGLGANLTINPSVIYSNQSASMSWNITGANFKWIHGWTPGYNGVNIYPAPATGSTTLSGLSPGTYSYTIEYGPDAFYGSRTTYAYLTVLGLNRTVAVSVSPPGSGSVSGAGIYAEGSTATLTATPDATHVFTGWSGDVSGSNNPLTFTVGARDYNAVANFAPRTFTVSTSASPPESGSVSGGGTYNTGATATLTATPAPNYAFTGWSGGLSGTSNPVSFAVNNNTSVVANFTLIGFMLTTAATAGGSVTPGGTYPAGSTITISATPDSTHRFVNWSGDVSGTASSIAVLLDRAKFAQANFSDKAPQTITFAPIGDRSTSSGPFALDAAASSGLPVSFSLLSGPATLNGNIVQLTGPGVVTIEATQPGDDFFLPAPPVSQSFNAAAPASLKYRASSRTLLKDGQTREGAPIVVEKP